MVSHILARFRPPKAQLNLQVSGAPLYPGGTVKVRVTGSCLEAVIAGTGRIELVCTESHWYTVKSTGARWIGSYPGHGEENYRGPPYTAMGRPGFYKATRDLVTLSEVLAADRMIPHDGPTCKEVTFTLPSDAPPSVQGQTARISWQLRASLFIEGAGEVRRNRQLVVLSPPHEQTAPPGGAPQPASETQTNPDSCDLFLSADTFQVRAGQPLSGILHARCQYNLHASEIRTELECLENAGAKGSRILADRMVLGREIHIRALETY